MSTSEHVALPSQRYLGDVESSARQDSTVSNVLSAFDLAPYLLLTAFC